MDTLRAWERRYKAVMPARVERGRLYGDADIRRLLLLRSAVESGRAIGQVASLSDAELEELDRQTMSFGRKQASPVAPDDVLPALQPLVDSIKSYDYAATNEELGRLAVLLRPAELVYRVVLPLMRLAGDNWESGVFHIAQEHMLSACVRNLLGGLVRLQNIGKGAGSLMFTTPSGELHEFGILAAAMLAVAHDFRVSYLGPSLPAHEVLLAVEKTSPQAVVLGIMKSNATPAVCEDMRRLASELPATIGLWLGGSGAAEVSKGLVRDGLFVLQDFKQFEQHLARLSEADSKESGL